jgi:hypothetical protein
MRVEHEVKLVDFNELAGRVEQIAARGDSASADSISNIELKFAFDLFTCHRIG